MSHVKIAKKLIGACKNQKFKEVQESVNAVLESIKNDQERILAPCYAVHYASDAMRERVMRALDYNEPNSISTAIAQSSTDRILTDINKAMDVAFHKSDSMKDLAYVISRAVYEAPSQDSESAICRVAERRTMDLSKAPEMGL